MEDIIQVGTSGLFKAIDRFEPWCSDGLVRYDVDEPPRAARSDLRTMLRWG
ncbi:hypothetical protein AB0D35_26355 [Streptomyces sp. NPDC048301]|uniref:hypothetical protein n=1 Tax=unclassified Streptomyces TaxID=2593676 RepID=UPI00343738B4